jgi:hypothetical protein
MRKTILFGLLLMFLIANSGCVQTPTAEAQPTYRKKSDPGTPDSPIIVTDTSTASPIVITGAGLQVRTTTSAHGAITHYDFTPDGSDANGSYISVSDTGGGQGYKIVSAKVSGTDSMGQAITDYPIPLDQHGWTLLVNNGIANSSFKLFSQNQHDLEIQFFRGTPFALACDGTTTYYDALYTGSTFSTLTVWDFGAHQLYPVGPAPVPVAGTWKVTFDYCKGGNCS